MRKGITRIVIPVGRVVFKFPRLGVGQINFLTGCLANLKERQKTKWGIYKNLIAPSLWCSWGGLCQIQRKINILSRPLSNKEWKSFKILTDDTKPNNFGYTKEGKLVCCDYGL